MMIREISLRIATVVCAGTVLSATACSNPPEPAAPEADSPDADAGEAEAPVEKEGDDPRESELNISSAILEACGIKETNAHFNFNSSNVRESDKAVLQPLSDCFATGPLKGRTMRIVGHADPRGEPEYNMVLGGKRSENVKTALVSLGLPDNQAEATSRGEMDARGTDEESWAHDRRVDIVLAEEN